MDGFEIGRALNESLAAISGAARRSLVQISSGQGMRQGAGAGMIWHKDGVIVTNAHVVGRGNVQVTLPDGETVSARLIAADPERDLAALHIDAHDLATARAATAPALPGQWVTAVGHPWGVLGASTSGIVIGTGREFPDMMPMAKDWVIASLRMRPGHSGGALVDAEGHVVGINTMITGPTIGLAIPVSAVQTFLDQVIGGIALPPHTEADGDLNVDEQFLDIL